MAKIIVARDQQAEMRRLHPEPAYSRLTAVRLVLAAGLPVEMVRTPMFGDRLWLLQVKVCIQQKVTNPNNINYLLFKIGGAKEATIAQVMNWESIIPLIDTDGMLNWWQFCDGCSCYEWRLKKFYERSRRRIAVLGYRTGADTSIINVTFEISEG
ncbi:hypothetical protein ES708_04969 [subsurface metagenome]